MNVTRSLWLCLVVILCTGYGLVVRPNEQSVNTLELHARDLYDESNANESKIRRSADLERVRSRVLGDVVRLSGQKSSEATTTVLLRLLNDETKRFHAEVRSINPVSGGDTPTGSANELPGTLWTIGLRGRFRDLLALIADLPEHDVLLQVRDIELAASSKEPSASPYLDATLSATVYRVATFSFTEDVHAAGIAR